MSSTKVISRLTRAEGRRASGRSKILRWVGLISVSAVAVGGCKEKERQRYTPGVAKAVLGVNMADVKVAISARVDSGAAPSWVPADQWRRVKALYKIYGNAPLWLEEEGVKERAGALLKAIEEAPTHALAANAYPLDSIRTVINAENVTKSATAKALADADVLLTAAYAAYATDMLVGQVDPKTVSQAWHIPAQPKEVDSALVRTLQSPSMEEGLTAMAPQDSAYLVLKTAFARYKQIADSGGWPTVAASGAGRIEALRKRLALEGFLSDTAHAGTVAQAGAPGRLLAAQAPSTQKGRAGRATSLASDPLLFTALKHYQERHGLATTGALSPATLEALNMPASERAQQIASNLERHRWLPRTLGARYIYVNVPAFRLEAHDSGRKALEMRVVVGAEYQGRATPVFSDSMEYVVFRPYWNVTDDIARKEIFPKLGADPGYLARGNYEIYNDHGTRRVRQRPGGQNALGMVKFMFPNEFNIYLHDTPQKSLFAKPDRAASHGCIRLEHPDQLAQFVLGWPADRVQQAMNGGADNRTITIPRKIPVYVVYFTSYARGGDLYFADDLYRRDEQLEEQVGDSTSTKADTATAAKKP